jgi:hypothetical protein
MHLHCQLLCGQLMMLTQLARLRSMRHMQKGWCNAQPWHMTLHQKQASICKSLHMLSSEMHSNCCAKHCVEITAKAKHAYNYSESNPVWHTFINQCTSHTLYRADTGTRDSATTGA